MKWTILDGDYYISPTYGDDATDTNGTMERPFRTLQKALAVDVLSKGNVANRKFVIEGGILFNESFAYSGRTYKRFVADGKRVKYNQNLPYTEAGDRWVNFMFAPNNSTEYLRINVLGSLGRLRYWENCVFIRANFDHATISSWFLGGDFIIAESIDTIASDSNGLRLKNATIIGGRYGTSYGSAECYNCYFDSRFWATTITSVYTACPASVWSMGGTNFNVDVANAGFVNPDKNNYNILSTSPLRSSGLPDMYTAVPSNIGGGSVVKSFNSDTLSGTTSVTHTQTIFDGDKSLRLEEPFTNGKFKSGVLDLGAKLHLKRLNPNITDLYIDELKRIGKFSDLQEPYLIAYASETGSTTSSIQFSNTRTMSGDTFSSSTDERIYVKIISGTGNSFTRQTTNVAPISQNTLTLSDTAGIYVGQQCSGTNIPAGSEVLEITDSTHIKISKNITVQVASGVHISFSQQRHEITSYDTINRVIGVSSLAYNDFTSSIQIPDGSTLFEVFKSPYKGFNFNFRWSSISAEDVLTQPWCLMNLDTVLKYSVHETRGKLGTADVDYDSYLNYYIEARYVQFEIGLRHNQL